MILRWEYINICNKYAADKLISTYSKPTSLVKGHVKQNMVFIYINIYLCIYTMDPAHFSVNPNTLTYDKLQALS